METGEKATHLHVGEEDKGPLLVDLVQVDLEARLAHRFLQLLLGLEVARAVRLALLLVVVNISADAREHRGAGKRQELVFARGPSGPRARQSIHHLEGGPSGLQPR